MQFVARDWVLNRATADEIRARRAARETAEAAAATRFAAAPAYDAPVFYGSGLPVSDEIASHVYTINHGRDEMLASELRDEYAHTGTPRRRSRGTIPKAHLAAFEERKRLHYNKPKHKRRRKEPEVKFSDPEYVQRFAGRQMAKYLPYEEEVAERSAAELLSKVSSMLSKGPQRTDLSDRFRQDLETETRSMKSDPIHAYLKAWGAGVKDPREVLVDYDSGPIDSNGKALGARLQRQGIDALIGPIALDFKSRSQQSLERGIPVEILNNDRTGLAEALARLDETDPRQQSELRSITRGIAKRQGRLTPEDIQGAQNRLGVALYSNQRSYPGWAVAAPGEKATDFYVFDSPNRREVTQVDAFALHENLDRLIQETIAHRVLHPDDPDSAPRGRYRNPFSLGRDNGASSLTLNVPHAVIDKVLGERAVSHFPYETMGVAEQQIPDAAPANLSSRKQIPVGMPR